MSGDYFFRLKNGFKNDWYKIPNLLTQIRLVGSIVPGLMLLLGPKDNNYLVVIVFLAIAATDLFDGFTARLLNQQTEYGKLLDPIADMFFGMFTLIAISIVNPLAWILTIPTIIRQIHLAWLIQNATKRNVPILAVIFSGKAKTAAVVVATALMLLPQEMLWGGLSAFVVGIASMLTIISWVEYWNMYSKV